MNIETIDDIVENMADLLGVYGCCKSDGDNDDCCKSLTCCRDGFEMTMKERIYAAIENEKKLQAVGL